MTLQLILFMHPYANGKRPLATFMYLQNYKTLEYFSSVTMSIKWNFLLNRLFNSKRHLYTEVTIFAQTHLEN